MEGNNFNKEKVELQRGFIQIPILIAVIVGVLVVGVVGYVGVKQYRNNQLKNLQTENVSENKQSTTEYESSEVEKPKQGVEESENDKPTASTQIQPLTPNQETVNTSSEVGIELCRVKARQEKEFLIDETNKIIKREQPGILALANASNNYETEKAALKYRYISKSDVVRSADVFQRLIDDGVPIENAKTIAEAAGLQYWTYIKNLHNWAEKELNKILVKGKSYANKRENEIYQECLKSL